MAIPKISNYPWQNSLNKLLRSSLANSNGSPCLAIVGIGKVVTRPWVIDGAIGPRSVITMTLSGDHRVTDGHAGALFLAEIGKLLQEPEKL